MIPKTGDRFSDKIMRQQKPPFASNLPEKCRISGAPEATSGRGGVLEARCINEELHR
jgi:hypothetical protein